MPAWMVPLVKPLPGVKVAPAKWTTVSENKNEPAENASLFRAEIGHGNDAQVSDPFAV